MSGLVHNFAAWKRKRDAILEQAADAVPEAAGGSSQPDLDGGSEVQAIVIPGSPEMSMNDQPTTGDVSMEEPREVSPVPVALQVVHPLEESTGWLDRSKYTRTGRRKPLLHDRMLVNSYLPPRDLAPPMEEVAVPGRRVLRRSLIDGGSLIGGRFQLIICMICTRRCCGFP